MTKVISDTYRTPLVLRLKAPDTRVSWDLSDVTEFEDLASYLQEKELSYSVREDGLVLISD